jgi:hypothetical protein
VIVNTRLLFRIAEEIETGTPFCRTVPPPVDETKLAVTDLAAVIATVQVPVPEQAPDHPLKVKPVDGVAVSTTLVPEVTDSVQTVPQEMPVGELVTVPVPTFAIDRTKV